MEQQLKLEGISLVYGRAIAKEYLQVPITGVTLLPLAIRPVALSRKNFLFAGSNEGGKSLALFYSLLASCKKQQVNL